MNKKKYLIKNIIVIILIIIFSILFIISSLNIINWKNNNNKNKQIQLDLQQFIIDEDKTIKENIDTEDNKVKVDFKSLKEKNSDTVGYLEVPNTNIKYVVVKGTDNSYYLNHNFSKEYNTSGWIFADYRNNFNDDYNIIIYGHNIRDGSMFGTLKNILKEKWYNNKDNLTITLATENKENKYQVFSIYEDKASDYPITTNFNNSDEYLNFLNTIKNKSIYNFNVEISSEQSILTLSTCATNNKNRVTLHAININ